MVLFFLLMSGLCAYLGQRMRDRWLVANGVVFLGLAFTPALSGALLIGWWILISLLMAWSMVRTAVRSTPTVSPQPTFHHAVCRPIWTLTKSD
ncbi:MAG: hypothetical protein SNJ72_02640 [Fimbriimonadales bacterium]